MAMPGAFQPAAEGPYPMYTGAPPDQQPMDLEGALAMADSIIWRDGGMDKNEQGILMAWIQNQMAKYEQFIQAAAAAGAVAGPQAQGLGSSGAGSGGQSINPFGWQGVEEEAGAAY